MKNIAFTLFCLMTFLKLQSLAYSSFIISTPSFQDNGKKMTIEEKLKKYEGTFQIQIKNIRMKPSIPYNIDDIIEKNRKENEINYISLGTDVRLKILSVNDIKKNGGKKLEMISIFKD